MVTQHTHRHPNRPFGMVMTMMREHVSWLSFQDEYFFVKCVTADQSSDRVGNLRAEPSVRPLRLKRKGTSAIFCVSDLPIARIRSGPPTVGRATSSCRGRRACASRCARSGCGPHGAATSSAGFRATAAGSARSARSRSAHRSARDRAECALRRRR
jgi:hypothetical protein